MSVLKKGEYALPAPNSVDVAKLIQDTHKSLYVLDAVACTEQDKRDCFLAVKQVADSLSLLCAKQTIQQQNNQRGGKP